MIFQSVELDKGAINLWKIIKCCGKK